MEKKRLKKIIKGYRLEKKLGSGSFGVVFKVVRLSDGRCLHIDKNLCSVDPKHSKPIIHQQRINSCPHQLI